MSNPDQLPSLPNDITFEICTSSSSSSPPPPPSTTPVVTQSGEDSFSEGNNGNTFIKSERVVGGMHFLTDREEDRGDLLLPKTESGEAEPEVRKQVGWSAAFDNASAGSAPPVPGFVRGTSTRKKRSRGDCTNRNGRNTRRPLRKPIPPRIWWGAFHSSLNRGH